MDSLRQALSNLFGDARFFDFLCLLILWALSTACLPSKAWRKLRILSLPAEKLYLLITRSRILPYVLFFCLSFSLHFRSDWQSRVPVPSIHDEYSYLLASDTFAHGRLTNPTPPAYVHFETFHVLVSPTYASKYPPLQGLFMALGQCTTGQSIVGIWFALALSCSAFYWMALAWIPKRWAFWGALIFVFHPLLIAWGDVYVGGSAQLLGGTLLLGSFKRLMRKNPRGTDGCIFGLALVLLANSRPGEGFLLSLICVCAIISHWLGLPASHKRDYIKPIVAPVFIVCLVGALWDMYYNFRVTGSCLILPYMAYTKQYDPVPLYVWYAPRPLPHYSNDVMRGFHEFYLKTARPAHVSIYQRCHDLFFRWLLVLSFPMTVTLLAIGFWISGIKLIRSLGKNSRTIKMLRLSCLIIALFSVGVLLQTYLFVNYVAPIGALTTVVSLIGLRYVGAIMPQRRISGTRYLLNIIFPLSVILLLCPPFLGTFRRATQPDDHVMEKSIERRDLESNLTAKRGKYLLLVHYDIEHNPAIEWVYNRAELANSPVIWARDLGLEQNANLLKAFPDRIAYIVYAHDDKPVVIQDYPSAQH